MKSTRKGNALRLVLTGSADLFTLEEALLRRGLGDVAGTLVDDYSTTANKTLNNQALATPGIPLTIYCDQGYSGVIIGQRGQNNPS